MIATLRQRDFSLLWFGWELSVIGDYFLFIALPFFVGPLLGGALLGLVGLGGLVLLDIASYLVSAAPISLISARSVVPAEEAAGAETAQLTASAWASALREWSDGLRLVGRDLRVATIFAVVAVAMMGEGVITVLIIVFVKDVLAGGATEFSWIVTAYGAGGIAGGFLAAWLGGAFGEARLLSLSTVANGLLLLLMFNVPLLPLVVALSVPAGATVVGWFVGTQTLLQKWVPDGYMGRVFGTYETTQALLMLAGIGLAAVLAGPLGAVVVLSVVGVLYVLVGAVASVTLPGDR